MINKSQLPAQLKLLEQICEPMGVSGFEEEIRETIREIVEPLADECWVDTLGTLYATKKGKRPERVMLDAHMDEIGLMVKSIDGNGFLRFDTIGGWDSRILPAQSVLVQTSKRKKYAGVIGSKPPHILSAVERKRVLSKDDLFIDVGATSLSAVAKMGIKIGDPVVLKGVGTPGRFGQANYTARNLDNRVGCAIAIEVLQAFKKTKPEMTLAVAFTIGEEVGLRGATVAARQLAPDACLVLEGTVAADVPDTPKQMQPSVQGAGPALTVADRRMIVPRRMLEFLEQLASDNKLSVQRKKPAAGGTDGGIIHLSGKGVLTGCMAIPCRYIHSPNQHMNLGDYQQGVKLATEFVSQAHELQVIP
jgi:endoglucanase